jgi:hypothetical protein
MGTTITLIALYYVFSTLFAIGWLKLDKASAQTIIVALLLGWAIMPLSVGAYIRDSLE